MAAQNISGTYFAQAREYLPEAGRFVSRDLLKGRVERPVSLNEYAYCHGNPIGYVDLNGMEETTPATNNFIDKGVGTTESWLIGKGIDRGEAEVTHRIAAHGIAQLDGRYEADISRQIRKLRKNPNAAGRRPGSLRLEQKRVIPEKVAKEQRKYDVARGRIKINEMTASEIGGTIGKGSVIGGVVDAGIGLGEDYVSGASRDKMMSNAAVNLGFGAAEGAFVAATSLFGPVGTAIGLATVIGYEVYFNHRDKVKKAINSLD